MEEDLDSILRWSIKDIYPEVEPSPRVWQRIRRRLVEVRPSARSLRITSLREKLSFYLEKEVWDPLPPSAVAARYFSQGYWYPLWPPGRAISQLAL